jgi:hypothetical protein
MKRISWTVAAILLGTVLSIAGCKGKAGPAGAAGTGPTNAPLCAAPAQMGYTVAGPTTGSAWDGRMYASPVTLADPGTAISITHYVASAAVSGQIRMGIYTDNANQPGNLVAETAPAFMTPSAWNTVNLLSNTYLPAGTYWVAFVHTYDTGDTYTSTGGNHRFVDIGWSVLPGVFPAASSAGVRFSQYINLCP